MCSAMKLQLVGRSSAETEYLLMRSTIWFFVVLKKRLVTGTRSITWQLYNRGLSPILERKGIPRTSRAFHSIKFDIAVLRYLSMV